MAELAELRKKEVSLAQRAQGHIEGAHSIIGIPYQEIDEAPHRKMDRRLSGWLGNLQ